MNKNYSMIIPEASFRLGVVDCDLVVLLDGVLDEAGLDMTTSELLEFKQKAK
jgi:hypothetical protein